MRTRRSLIIYGTRYGQTAKVAEHMRAALARDGLDVVVANAGSPATDVDPEHDGVHEVSATAPLGVARDQPPQRRSDRYVQGPRAHRLEAGDLVCGAVWSSRRTSPSANRARSHSMTEDP